MYMRIVRAVKTPGQRLKSWREGEPLTQSELAALVGVHQGTISRVESGLQEPDLALAIDLAKLAKDRGSRLPVDMWVSRAIAS